jgi:elongation factor G
MAKYKPEDIRNVVIAGHGGTGKTTLLDEFLYATKANSRIGLVKDGSSLSDTSDDEIDGRASIDLTLIHSSFRGKLFHWFDSPGRSDFLAQYVMGLYSTQTVLVVVDAYTGIQVNTRRAWKMARSEGKAVAIVVTKLDVEGVDLPKLLGSIQSTFGKECVPFFVPDGTGAALTRVHSVLDLAEGAPAMAQKYREGLVESIVETDEELMMRYLEGEDVSADLKQHVAKAIKTGTLVPVLMFGQRGSVGVKEILDTLVDYFPAPDSETEVSVGEEETLEDGTKRAVIRRVPIEANTFLAQVIRVVVDEHKGKMAIMRVISGQVVPGGTFHNVSRGTSGKFGKLFKFFGNKQEEVDSAGTGELVAAAKVEGLGISDTVSDGTWTMKLAPLPFPPPMVALAIKPKTRADEGRISMVIQRFMAEDPTFRMEVDRQTKEMVIFGLSELHLNVILARMARRHRVEVETRLPKISYRETISKSVSDFYRHKKQSGGSGEFAEVHFKMRPFQGEEDFSFVDGLRGDGVRRQFVPSVEKGCRSIMEDGILTGSPVINVEVEFFDGKDHPVDGKDAAFQKAARECFKKCFMQASPQLLEPVVNLEVSFPGEFAGEINQYLSAHRGRISGMDSLGEEQVLRASIPLAEIRSFSADLRSMTQGQGSYSIDPAGYQAVPPPVQADVIAAYQAQRSGTEE